MGDNDHHYIPGLPIEHPMTLAPSFHSSLTLSNTLHLSSASSAPTPRHTHMTPCYIHSQTSLGVMPDLLGPGSHAKGYLLYTFNTFV